MHRWTVLAAAGALWLAATGTCYANDYGGPPRQIREVLGEVADPPARDVERLDRLAELFRASAPPADLRYQPFQWQGRGYQNLVVELEGSDPDAPCLILGAHTDATKDSPGIVDNWSSCVMLAALYRGLAHADLTHTVIFVGFGCEEHGLHGSQAFLRERSTLPCRIRAMINLECLGVGQLRTWANASADDLEQAFRAVSGPHDAANERLVLFGYMADSFSFSRAGIPAVTIHSLSGRDLSFINTPRDDGRHLHPSRYVQAYEVLRKYVLYLDRRVEPIRPLDRDARLEPVHVSLRAAPGKAGEAVAGVKLASLSPTSREFRAGLRGGDILMELDGVRIRSPFELGPMLQTLYRGKQVCMKVRRPGGAADSQETLAAVPGVRTVTVTY